MNSKDLPAVVAIVWGFVFVVGSSAKESPPPNLLVIQTDEHHYATLGCYGGETVETPHIDWLADQGALCTSFYATTPVCSPSRAALVSGRYPQNTPVVTNNVPLADDIVTFAALLGQAGYATGYAGKWHLDGAGKPQWAPRRKFGFEDNRFMFNRGHWKKFGDTDAGPRIAARNQQGKPTYAVEGADKRSFATDWLTDKAIDFIRQHRDQPFCYMLSLPDPHGPNTVRAPYDTMYRDRRVPIPTTLRKTDVETPQWAQPERNLTPDKLAKLMPHYYGMVKCIDDNVGRILGTLRSSQLMGNTIVVFTSDHGDLCGEHGRLNKGVPYEGSARVPFVIHYPPQIRPGTIVNEALTGVDFMPTILALMNAPAKIHCEGRDASALLTGKDRRDWHDVAFIRGTHNWFCALTDRYKLVYASNDEPWLFDLEQDPEERLNRFSLPQYQTVVRDLTSQLDQYSHRYKDPYRQQAGIKEAMDKVLAAGGSPGGALNTKPRLFRF